MKPGGPIVVLGGFLFLAARGLLGETAATPVASPPAGTYGDGLAVTLSSATPGAAIHFTTDGSAPSRQSPLWDGTPIPVDRHVTGENRPPGATSPPLTTVSRAIRAIAVADGLADSATLAADYVIDRVDATFDVPYLDDGLSKHLLDVYHPKGMTGTPVVFFVHGGAWTQGSKEVYFELGNTLAGSYGMTVVVISYRLSPPGGTSQHPDHVEDVAAAFDWTVRNISRYGGDPEKVVAFGQSAGGHLVSLLATDGQYLARRGLSPAALRGVVTMSGAYDLWDLVDVAANPLGLSAVDLAAYRALTAIVFGGSSRPKLDSVSPQTFASSGQPPFLVIGLEESEGFVDMPGFAAEARGFSQHLQGLVPAPAVTTRWLAKGDIPSEVLAIDIPDFDYDGHYHEIYAINTLNWNSVSTRMVADWVLGLVSRRLVVPVVVDVSGEGGARFSTELTLTNTSSVPATASLTYRSSTTAPAATLGGTLTRAVPPGGQVVVPDTIAALASSGATVTRAKEAGALRVDWIGLAPSDGGFVSARTTTGSTAGRAGLACAGAPPAELAASRALVFGLRENARDRSNLAVANAGMVGTVTLRVTLFPGSPGTPPVTLTPDLTLLPGEWRQLSRVLSLAGLTEGYAAVERVSGSEPFLSYGVVNDNGTGDGSFVAMVAPRPAEPLLLPVVVETPVYTTELVVANPTSNAVTARLSYVESLDPGTLGTTATASLPLAAGEQRIVASAFDLLREGGSVGPKGRAYAGSVAVSFVDAGGSLADGFAGSRTAAPNGLGGSYGLSTSAMPLSRAAAEEAWVTSLAQTGSVRSNLALAATGSAPVTLRVELFDGATGLPAGEIPSLELGADRWAQLDRVLSPFGIANGYARVSRVSGSGRFLAYGVVNEAGTNDGSFLEMTGGR